MMQTSAMTLLQNQRSKTPVWSTRAIFWLLTCFIVYLFLENYLLIISRPTNSPGYIAAQAFKYAVLGIALTPFVLRLNRRANIVLGILLLITLYGLILTREPIVRVATSLRDTMLYLYIFTLISSAPIKRKDQIFHKLIGLVLLFATINIIYAVYTFVTFNGDLSTFYFYAVSIQPFLTAEPNYIRNDLLRTSGLFVSPITFSNLLILPCAYIIARLIKRFSWSSLLLLLISIVGLLSTQTRAPFLALFIAIALWTLLKVSKMPVLIPSLVIAIVFFSFFGLSILYNLNLLEPSSAGRVDQTNIFLAQISNSPFGLGFGGFGAQFENATDLSILTVFYNFGIFVGAFYYFLLLRQLYILSQRILMPSFTHTSSQNFQFTTAFLALSGLIVMSINTNVFDGVVPMLNAVILGICSNNSKS